MCRVLSFNETSYTKTQPDRLENSALNLREKERKKKKRKLVHRKQTNESSNIQSFFLVSTNADCNYWIPLIWALMSASLLIVTCCSCLTNWLYTRLGMIMTLTHTHTLSLYRPWSQGYLQPWQDALITGHMNHLVGVWYCVFVLRDKER